MGKDHGERHDAAQKANVPAVVLGKHNDEVPQNVHIAVVERHIAREGVHSRQ